MAQLGFTYTINWGDGSPVQIVQATANNGSGVTLDHQYTSAGNFAVSVTATNHDGVVSSAAMQIINISAGGLLGDPLHPGQNALFISGTAGRDLIRIRQVTNGYAVAVTTGSSTATSTFAGPVSRIVVYTGDGNDTVRFNKNVLVPTWIYGGAGNDNLRGAANAPSVIVGGTGNNVLLAGSHRDILIGGAGSEKLFGGTSQDLLIAGTTSFDHNEAALNALQLEWNARRSYAARVANLRGTGTGARNNGSFFLVASGANETVFGSHKGNTLTGGTGQDWFFAKVSGSGLHDTLLQRTPSETVDRLA
jgi:Ca2+-binding RTX toxin-like protein